MLRHWRIIIERRGVCTRGVVTRRGSREYNFNMRHKRASPIVRTFQSGTTKVLAPFVAQLPSIPPSVTFNRIYQLEISNIVVGLSLFCKWHGIHSYLQSAVGWIISAGRVERVTPQVESAISRVWIEKALVLSIKRYIIFYVHACVWFAWITVSSIVKSCALLRYRYSSSMYSFSINEWRLFGYSLIRYREIWNANAKYFATRLSIIISLFFLAFTNQCIYALIWWIRMYV